MANKKTDDRVQLTVDSEGVGFADGSDSDHSIRPRKRTPQLSTLNSQLSTEFCVYLGPSIRGVMQNGTVFQGGKAAALARLADVTRAHPLIAGLIVDGGALPESRVRVKTPGNLLYVNYHKLAGTL